MSWPERVQGRNLGCSSKFHKRLTTTTMKSSVSLLSPVQLSPHISTRCQRPQVSTGSTSNCPQLEPWLISSPLGNALLCTEACWGKRAKRNGSDICGNTNVKNVFFQKPMRPGRILNPGELLQRGDSLKSDGTACKKYSTTKWENGVLPSPRTTGACW